MSFLRFALFFVFTSLALQAVEGPRKLNVLMRAWADDSYIRKTDSEGIPAIETCTYMKGQYYPGFHDEPENAIQFENVAEILRDQLVTQNYVMATDSRAADLLLVINWGMTEEPDVDETVLFEDDEGNEILDFDLSGVGESTRRLNSLLIGAGGMEDLSRIHIKRRMLEEAIKQERYFINVIAYDMSELRDREKGTPIPKPQWMMLLSVPLQGVDADYAFGTMAETASVYFGKDLKNADFIRQDAKRAVVTIGEIEFLDDDEDGDEP
ncbi:MAG: hypothetical protein ACSHYA_10070 [Opitutaceae bacterium]